MGMDTGADKHYRITENNEVVFEGFYDTIEGVHLKYPNGEFVELADTIKLLTKGEIDLRKYLIWDEILNHEKPDYSHIIKQLEDFTFEKAIEEGVRAKRYIKEHYDDVRKNYRYIFDPLAVLNYLLSLWRNEYYVNYSY